MTDYNDGRWHGWNGGECPVHPETLVEIVYFEEGITHNEALCKYCDFSDEADLPIIAFRVVKEHREPREWWIVPGRTEMPCSIPGYYTKPCVGAVRVREVFDDEKSEGL
ncbi:hypothetical protein SAMN04489859_100890 [Paracoccus alcaliphilus]|uniref:Uncharacterized protein n=1 Tax=Paracoccus alcaliphilus TaxID=34002 RepID=A0A1H8H2L7_9RHOB|nr:hypothetical protein [Paracoccus alcaliphilus]WCR17404.1 hypothetical protein JHW40_13785 [Paracoccus alcaliphilus]SEN50496.1 hypothetical protein SAMN04489859_100890 [Paracoccus alcaliphilus]